MRNNKGLGDSLWRHLGCFSSVTAEVNSARGVLMLPFLLTWKQQGGNDDTLVGPLNLNLVFYSWLFHKTITFYGWEIRNFFLENLWNYNATWRTRAQKDISP